MLINRDEPAVSARVAQEVAKTPVFARVLEVFDADGNLFELAESTEGLELKPADPPGHASHRCRLKLFTPREGKERVCAFFYKQSNLAWSRDRFSYGGVEFRPERLIEEDVRSWARWLVSGLDPGQKPERLRRSFLYDIPE